jgi:protein-disulfide isomerase
MMISLLIGGAFIVGMFYTRMQSLEKAVAELSQGNARVAAAPVVGNANPPTNNQVVAQAPPPAPVAGDVDPVTEEDHVRGDRQARIMLIEYSDLECPFCKRFHSTAQQVVDTYDGQVAWVYRHFPLVQLHSKAPKEAEATECVAELGGEDKFWSYVDKLFEVTPANNGLDEAQLPALAVQVGISETQFNTCLDSGRYAQKVQDHLASGQRAGVTGTPGNILLDTKSGKTQLIAGALPFDQMKQAVDQMLAQ